MSDDPHWQAPAPTPFDAWNEPGIGPIERTRRLVHVRAELRDHMAFNLWCGERGSYTLADLDVWKAMPDDERAGHEARMMARMEAHWAAEDAKPRPPEPPGGGGEPVPLRRIA